MNLPGHLFRYHRFTIDKSQPLGHGSYGAVYKAKCDQLPCAAKVLHPTIQDPMDPGAGRIMDRFRQECSFLESIRHPNIVQYLGMSTDPESRLPVLLMELLDESLTKMLERSQQPLSSHIQVDICHDIALAVAYLHSNDIIHRDLSSNNVLMITGRRAKVTDFGMSKLSRAAPTMTPLTVCPGTLAYMPPEALREPPRYTKGLDCFSEGVMMIQVCTRLWPEPGPRTQIIEDSRYPMGFVEMPVAESERRKNHIDLVDPTHPLLPIAMDCLKYQQNDRPSGEELCQRLAGLKESSEYRDNVREQRDEIKTKDDQIMALSQQLRDKEEAIRDNNFQLRDKNDILQTKNEMLVDKDRQLECQSRLIVEGERQLRQLSQQLEEQEQVTAEIQQTNHSLQRQVEQLQQQLQDKDNQLQAKNEMLEDKDCQLVRQSLLTAERERQLRQLSHQLEEQKQFTVEIQQTNHSLHRQLLSQQNLTALENKPHPQKIVHWRDGGKAPFEMTSGVATVDENFAYFMDWDGNTHSYDSSSKKWSVCPKYLCEGGCLAVINGQLTAIGGCRNVYDKSTYTNELLSLYVRDGWTSVFPPMPTKRHHMAALATKELLIVAGGTTGPLPSDIITTVEVMDTRALVWSTVASLPHPFNLASSVICGDNLYMLGGVDDEGRTKSVLTCSLTELLQSSSSSPVWYRVADSPTYFSTCVAVSGELLAVGGYDENGEATTAVHKYTRTTNSWHLISNMATARWRCLVAVLPTSELMVVGGKMDEDSDVGNIEIATLELC